MNKMLLCRFANSLIRIRSDVFTITLFYKNPSIEMFLFFVVFLFVLFLFFVFVFVFFFFVVKAAKLFPFYKAILKVLIKD